MSASQILLFFPISFKILIVGTMPHSTQTPISIWKLDDFHVSPSHDGWYHMNSKDLFLTEEELLEGNVSGDNELTSDEDGSA